MTWAKIILYIILIIHLMVAADLTVKTTQRKYFVIGIFETVIFGTLLYFA